MRKKVKEYFSNHRLLLYAPGILVYSLLISLLMYFSWGELPSEAEVGQIARHDIRADKDYQILDDEATEHLREEARVKADKAARVVRPMSKHWPVELRCPSSIHRT